MEIILILLCVPTAYLVLLAGTIDIFYRKGQSWVLGLVVGLFLPVIGLIVALVMPYDQPALEERKQREQIDQQRNRENVARWQREYDERHAAGLAPLPPLPDYSEPPALATVQTVCACTLIASLFLSIVPISPTYTGIMGILATVSLLGLTVTILLPVGSQ